MLNLNASRDDSFIQKFNPTLNRFFLELIVIIRFPKMPTSRSRPVTTTFFGTLPISPTANCKLALRINICHFSCIMIWVRVNPN